MQLKLDRLVKSFKGSLALSKAGFRLFENLILAMYPYTLNLVEYNIKQIFYHYDYGNMV